MHITLLTRGSKLVHRFATITYKIYVPEGKPLAKANTKNSKTTSAFMVHCLLTKELVNNLGCLTAIYSSGDITRSIIRSVDICPLFFVIFAVSADQDLLTAAISCYCSECFLAVL